MMADILTMAAVFAVWWVVNRILLPKMGVST